MHMLDEPFEFGEHHVRIGASVGIAIFPEDAADIETLCIAADRRMYDTKHGAATKQAEESFSAGSGFPPHGTRRRVSGLRVADG
jgi:predicted signal transduction protein with EAL and GGDEF domain